MEELSLKWDVRMLDTDSKGGDRKNEEIRTRSGLDSRFWSGLT